MEEKDIFILEILVVILLSLGFEQIKERLDHRFHSMGKKGVKMMLMKETLFGEIMTLGFIGLLVFIMTKTGEAKMLAASLFNRDLLEEEEDPLSETFEVVHMVMFCVMVTFIAQCSLLMYIASRQSSTWERWESSVVNGNEPQQHGGKSLRQQLVSAGYLEVRGKELIVKKMINYSDAWWSIFTVDNTFELIAWRAVRHEFMFPSVNAESHDHKETHLRSVIHNVKEPHCFSFCEYLDEALGEAFVELVEVDLMTWIIAALLCPLLHCIMSVDSEYHVTIACAASWMWVLLTIAFGINVYSIYFQLTPELPKDPKEVLQIFAGTSPCALKRRRRKDHAEARASGRISPAGSASGALTDPLLANGDDHVKNGDCTEIARIPARFRQRELPPLVRPWYIQACIHLKLLGSHSAPNDQQRLFVFQEWGKHMYPFFLEFLMFMQSITNACYIVLWCTEDPDGWTTLQWTSFFIGIMAPLLNLLYFVPKIVSKLAVICSIEYYKDQEKIEAVVFSQKKKQLLESLKLLRVAKLRGRIARLAGKDGKLSRETFYEQVQQFEALDKKKKNDIVKVFKMFDADNSGTISKDEMVQVINSMNMAEGSDAGDAALQLFEFVDHDSSGQLELLEFKVLMCLALYQPNDKEEKQDMVALFKTFDSDGSGHVSISELANYFTMLGVHIADDEMAELIYSVFKVAKQQLTSDNFVHFMCKLEELE